MALQGTLTTGDDTKLPVQLYKGDSDFIINGSATIKASLITKDRTSTLLTPVTLSNSATGADWFTSRVVVEFTSAETGAITPAQVETGENLLEIQVDDGGKLTFFVKIKLIQGTIDQ